MNTPLEPFSFIPTTSGTSATPSTLHGTPIASPTPITTMSNMNMNTNTNFNNDNPPSWTFWSQNPTLTGPLTWLLVVYCFASLGLLGVCGGDL
ncbi:Hypothetical predicted protein [Lecanosticta acicola]|uniref:Uncharacterized protein n=1 Tax=Lecanosticta acicola TaxID=111012 RepID=A0AAI8YV83_9PEZI|nr:Hypothetical predicted protein [Lecanosticta acicola]